MVKSLLLLLAQGSGEVVQASASAPELVLNKGEADHVLLPLLGREMCVPTHWEDVPLCDPNKNCHEVREMGWLAHSPSC